MLLTSKRVWSAWLVQAAFIFVGASQASAQTVAQALPPTPAAAPPVSLAAATSQSSSLTQTAMTTEEGLALAKAKACLGCHQIDKKRVGPAFSAVAERRAEQPDALSYLTQVIRKGGRGQWGAVPMPGQAVNEQDAQKLAQWVISLRK